MRILPLDDLRPQSHWLALILSFTIISGVIVATLLWPGESSALNSALPNVADAPVDGYQSPQRCRECHEAEFQAWSNTTHAQASFDPIFQTYLHKAQEPGECFACHATGYNTNTGQFVMAGVTCEACHGPYRAEHPEESMIIASSEDLCGECHPSTLLEWESSRHGMMGVTCIDCHEVHTQRTRVADTRNSLCANCHHDVTRDVVHVPHSPLSLQCVDCHLSRPVNQDESTAVNGHAATGHSFAVAVSVCKDCHIPSSSPAIP